MTNPDQALVLITGAAGGFGRELMRQFAAAGSELIVHDLHEEPLRASIRDVLPDASVVRQVLWSDLSTADGCLALYEQVVEEGRMPDIVVNNAGIGVGGKLQYVPVERWEQVMQINLVSPMRLCQLFLPAMIEKKHGHFLNVGSMASWAATSNLSSYVASKFGLRGFGESLFHDVKEHGIHVTTVYPWFSRTPILDSPQFGPDPKMEIPDDIVTDPADIVAAMIDGVRKNKLHVFPDKYARRLQFMIRHFPRLFGFLNERLEKKIRDDAQ